jgi:hypothetical protein
VSNYVGKPHRGAWLVYLNGIEVPCPSVTVNYGVWMIPEATLSFPPHRLLHRLGAEDRIEVVVFYLDDLADPKNPEFRLLFEGEILGWSYTSSSSGRQMSFNAIADISIFTQLHYFFLNNIDTVTDYAVTAGAQAGGVSQAGAFYPFSLFKKGLIVQPGKDKDANPPDITRPYEIIYNAVRGMVDARLNDQKPSRRAVPAINFFSRWVRKRNFINRFAALPLFEDDTSTQTKGAFPILQAVQATTALQTLQNNMAAPIGNAGTIWDVLKETYGHVLFEVAMLPTAPAARVRVVDATPEKASDGTIIGPAGMSLEQVDVFKNPVRLINYFVKPQMFFGIAPTCNVLFPCMNTNYSYSESYLAQPTRTYVNDQFVAGALTHSPFVAAALSFGYPPEVDVILREKTGAPVGKDPATGAVTAGKPGNTSWSGKNLLVFPEEFFKGPVMSRMPVPAWFTYLKNREGRTNVATTESSKPEDLQEAASLRELMYDYVKYEHYRGRYEKRGGAVNMAWNPYVVPGFPCVIFDHKSSGFHTMGYLSNVSQTLSLGGMSTAVNYSLSRTIPEMLDLLNQEMKKLNPTGTKNPVVFGSAPLEPISSVRDIIQDFTKAEQFYNALFFQREPMKNGKKASFDFREVLGYARTDGKVDAIKLGNVEVNSSVTAGSFNVTNTTSGGSTTNVNASATQSTVAAGETTNNVISTTTTESVGGFTSQTVLVNTLSGTRDVVPLPAFVPVFNQYGTAMQYVARPICNLDDYLSFLHGPTADLQTLINDGQVELGDDRFGDVLYFKRIRKLFYDPNYTPTPAEVGVTTETVNPPVPPTAYTDPLVGAVNASQTRADWDSALVAYQAEMYNRKGPQE